MGIYNWHLAQGISHAGLEDGKLTEISIAGKRVGLLKKGTALYAFAAACPHAGVALCTGWVDALGRIVCPEHNYRFDPANGRNTSGEGYKLYTYPVEIRTDGVFIGFISS